MNINLFIKNILDKLKKDFFNKNKEIVKEELIDILDEEKNQIDTNNKSPLERKINIEFSNIDEYINFLKEKLQQNICMSSIDIHIWNKFNIYTLSKFTKERIDEYEEMFYSIIEASEEYCKKNNISIFNRWFNNDKARNMMKNDISFLIRYDENLLRRKYNKKSLSYDKFIDFGLLKEYLDKEFESLINERLNNISSNIPSTLFDIELEDFEFKEDNFYIENETRKMNIKKAVDNSKEDKSCLINIEENINNKDLDSIIKDIDDFEI